MDYRVAVPMAADCARQGQLAPVGWCQDYVNCLSKNFCLFLQLCSNPILLRHNWELYCKRQHPSSGITIVKGLPQIPHRLRDRLYAGLNKLVLEFSRHTNHLRCCAVSYTAPALNVQSTMWLASTMLKYIDKSSESVVQDSSKSNETTSAQTPLQCHAVITSTMPDGAHHPKPHELYTKDMENGWTWGNTEFMTAAELEKLKQVVRDRKHAFAYSMQELVGYRGLAGPFTIELTTTTPIFNRQRRYSALECEIREEKCQELFDNGIIAPAPKDCKYASCPTMPAKKDANGNWTDRRFCIDLRSINKMTVLDKYGMHNPEMLFNIVGTSRIFTKMDLRAGFHQIPIEPGSQSKTAFWWGNALYVYVRMCFGLSNATAAFQRIMDMELASAKLSHCAFAFVDDLLVHSETAEEHLVHVAQVLDCLANCGLRVHPDKSVFGASVVEYLGHNISAHGLSPHSAKTMAIQHFKEPTNVTELKSILGFINYYRCYCPSYSTIAAPLNTLLKKNSTWNWGPEHTAALQGLKDSICQEGRALKRFDLAQPTTLHTDWSKNGIGAILSQTGQDGNEYLVACVSRSLNAHEKNYSSYEGELLAVVWSAKVLRPYLHGIRFSIVTDHQPLVWLATSQDLTGKHARWALSLMDFDFEIIHRPGIKHANADVPSRFPLPDTDDGTGARLDTEATELDSNGQPTSVPAAATTMVMPKRRHQILDTYATESFLHTATLDAAQSMCNHAGYDVVQHIPSRSELLQDNAGAYVTSLRTSRLDTSTLSDTSQNLAAQAQLWVKQANLVPSSTHCHKALEFKHIIKGASSASVVRHLNTHPVAGSAFDAMFTEGIVLLELFGGMCAVLDMCLQNNVRIASYIYCDNSPAAQQLAKHRISTWCGLYPHLLPPTAVHTALGQLPMDVRDITHADLERVRTRYSGLQWFIAGGFDCSDTSSAGLGEGINGSRSNTYHDCVRIIGTLQQILVTRPPIYLIENTAMNHNFSSTQVRQVDYPFVCSQVGTPVEVDAARFGSRAHRHRLFWTNIVDSAVLQAVIDTIQRPANLYVNDILDSGRYAQLVSVTDKPPFYVCNVKGELMQALPTLVAYKASRAFKDDKSGMIWDSNCQIFTEPNVHERERALGYTTDATFAPGLTHDQRFQFTGRCMDGNTMRSLMALALALNIHIPVQTALCAAHDMEPKWPRQMPPLPLQDLITSKGFRMLNRHGWTPGTSLGKVSEGHLVTPLQSDGHLGQAMMGDNRLDKPGGIQFVRALVPDADTNEDEPYALRQAPTRHGILAPTSRSHADSMHGGVPQVDTKPENLIFRSYPEPESWPLITEVPPSQAFACISSARVFSTFQHNYIMAVTASHNDQQVHIHMSDVWNDQDTLSYIRTGELRKDLNHKQRDRVLRRAKAYRWLGEKLYRLMPDDTQRVCPSKDERTDVIKQTHSQNGHFGVKRTKALVLQGFWWSGIEKDVIRVLAHCRSCKQVEAVLNSQHPVLHPLPIRGLFYRWGVDLAGPLPETKLGNLYVMICIEHLSKHVELIPLRSKTSEQTAHAFLSHVLGRFGSCAEVLTDQGSEFKGEFNKMLDQALIDHRVASADHPQTDGLAERAVRTIKKALAKHCEDTETADGWDKYLPYIGLGYRASPQASTGFSPYELLYGVAPVIPPAIKARIERPIDFANEEEASAYVLSRAKDLREHMPIAMGNLETAQHRQAEAYRARRTGNYMPRMRKFSVGDFVYRKRSELNSTIQTKVKRGIFRVIEVRDNGVLVLQGKCGGVFSEHMENCAPCHLAGIDPTINPTLQEVTVDTACCICQSPDNEADMLLCDGCNQGYHIYCLKPALPAVPSEAIWICEDCRSVGIDEETVKQREDYVDADEPIIFPNAAMRKMDAAAQLLDGRTVKLKVGKGKSKKVQYAVLVYQPRGGRTANKHFVARFADGKTMDISYKTAVDNLCQARQAAAAIAEAQDAAQEKESYGLQTRAEVARSLQLALPGQYSTYRVALVHNALCTLPAMTGISAGDFKPLNEALSWVHLGSCVDRWDTMNAVRSKIEAHVTTFHKCLPETAKQTVLSHYWHAKMQSQFRNDLYLLYMPSELLDLVLPLSVIYTGKLVAALIPAVYVANGPAPRLRWLQKLSHQGRLVYLPAPSKGDVTHAWIIIGTSEQMLKVVLHETHIVSSRRLPMSALNA
jgi:RNase H-like domain found in reverse transcriptase/Reverse transcriptase (RNA-dependent DNA polymerase)/Integrase zinc binding domain/PHD-finger